MDVTDFTLQIVQTVTQELEAFKTGFEKEGVSWRGPEIEVWQDDPAIYTSELRINFYRKGDMVDVFEFFILKDGVPNISEPEIREWIRENAEEMLRRLQTEE